jgi:hypothetical protein
MVYICWWIVQGKLVLSSFFVKGDDSRLMINEQILRRIRKLKQNTLYPGLLHNNFQVIKFLDEPNIARTLPPAGDTPPDRQQNSARRYHNFPLHSQIDPQHRWVGRKWIQTVRNSMLDSLLDSRGPRGRRGVQKVGCASCMDVFLWFVCHERFWSQEHFPPAFLGLVFATASYFPPVCSRSLEKFCRTSIRRMRKGYGTVLVRPRSWRKAFGVRICFVDLLGFIDCIYFVDSFLFSVFL